MQNNHILFLIHHYTTVTGVYKSARPLHLGPENFLEKLLIETRPKCD